MRAQTVAIRKKDQTEKLQLANKRRHIECQFLKKVITKIHRPTACRRRQQDVNVSMINLGTEQKSVHSRAVTIPNRRLWISGHDNKGGLVTLVVALGMG